MLLVSLDKMINFAFLPENLTYTYQYNCFLCKVRLICFVT